MGEEEAKVVTVVLEFVLKKRKLNEEWDKNKRKLEATKAKSAQNQCSAGICAEEEEIK